MTEEEIYHGILSNSEIIKKRALVFIREINNYENIPLDDKNKINLAKKFIELDEYDKIDLQIKKKMNDLKCRVYKKIPKNCIFKYEVCSVSSVCMRL